VPDNVYVHGFLTVNNGEKMSKSRGTGLDPLKYLQLGMNAEWLRYYLAAKLSSSRNEDIDFNADDFMAARQQRPDRQVHQHRQRALLAS
jgi:methionyl-tRNA synthetase